MKSSNKQTFVIKIENNCSERTIEWTSVFKEMKAAEFTDVDYSDFTFNSQYFPTLSKVKKKLQKYLRCKRKPDGHWVFIIED